MMNRRNPLVWLIGAVGLAALLWLAFGYFGIHTAFTSTEVNEDFPVAAVATSTPEATSEPSAEPEPTAEPVADTAADEAGAAAEGAIVEPTAEPTVEPTAEPQPTATPAGPVLVASGSFHDVDHKGVGTALVYQQPDGSYILRFEDFDIENGPDLYVYAVAAPDAFDSQTVLNSEYINIAQLKGNQGNQNYELPADFDPSKYTAITIWCERFGVNMVTAPLS